MPYACWADETGALQWLLRKEDEAFLCYYRSTQHSKERKELDHFIVDGARGESLARLPNAISVTIQSEHSQLFV